MTGARTTAFRLAIVVLLVAVVVLVAACGGDDDETPAPTPSPVVTPEPTPVPGEPTPIRDCPPATGEAPEVQMKSYDGPPEMTIDPSRSYTATVRTVRGDFTLELLPELAPQHVNSFVFLARDGFYDGVTFHRVVPGFVAQAGDPTGTGSGGPGYTLDAEFTDELFVRGVLGMARTQDPNSAGSQWFVTFDRAEHLDGQYTVFGRVTSGMEVVDCIEQGDAISAIEIAE